jgi:uncharacterized protein YlxW (UPF0749 family)
MVHAVKRSLVPLVLVTALMLVLGILIAAQIRAETHQRQTAADGNEQALLLSELAEVNMRLRAEIESLKAQQTAYEADSRVVGLEELVAELNRVRVWNGTIEVSGPGVDLLIDGPLSALDLQDTLNELRNAGAEAIALNDQRVVVSSVIVIDGKGRPVLDGYPLERPYRFSAIGDPDTLETALLRSGGVLALFRRAHTNLVVQVSKRPRLTLAVYRPRAKIQFAQPAE